MREVGRSHLRLRSFSLLLLSIVSSSSYSYSRGVAIAFLFCLYCARCSLALSFSSCFTISASSSLPFFLFRRAKMVHGRSRALISPRILRGGSTSRSFISCVQHLSRSCRFIRYASLLRSRFAVVSRFFFFAMVLSLCTRSHRSLS